MAGICGHDNVSDALHQSDHDDPGPYFPWDRFMALVQGKPATPGDLTMSDVNTVTNLIKAANNQLHHDIGVVQTQNGKLREQIEKITWVKNPVTGKKWRITDALKVPDYDPGMIEPINDDVPSRWRARLCRSLAAPHSALPGSTRPFTAARSPQNRQNP